MPAIINIVNNSRVFVKGMNLSGQENSVDFGGQCDELRGHHAAGRIRRIGEELAHVLRLVDFHLP